MPPVTFSMFEIALKPEAVPVVRLTVTAEAGGVGESVAGAGPEIGRHRFDARDGASALDLGDAGAVIGDRQSLIARAGIGDRQRVAVGTALDGVGSHWGRRRCRR